MKGIIALVAAVIPMILSYDEKFDKLNVDKILGDDKLFTRYINCWLEKGPCDLELAEEYKQLLPEIVVTTCRNCSSTQKEQVRKVVRAFLAKNTTELAELEKKYDPRQEHAQALTAFLLAYS